MWPVVADRQGSIKKFYPYGTERPSASANDTEKFTGYYRDASTGLDYADQRYHQPGGGRFMSPDPSGSGSNLYAYAGGDPVNNVDRDGRRPIPEGCDQGIDSYIEDCGRNGGMNYQSWFIIDPVYDEEGEIKDYDAYYKMLPNGGFRQAFFDARDNNLAVRAGLASLRNALSGDPDCLNFLESGIAGGSTAVFNAFYNQLIGVNGTPTAGASDFRGTQFQGLNGVVREPSTGYLFTINSAGAFFSTSVGVGYGGKYDAQVGGLQPGTPSAQYFILLHELAHYFGATGFIQGDSALGSQRINNDMIWDKCNKTVQGAGKGTA